MLRGVKVCYSGKRECFFGNSYLRRKGAGAGVRIEGGGFGCVGGNKFGSGVDFLVDLY